MIEALYNTTAKKKPTNLSINSSLLALAKEYQINLSQTLEQRLIELLQDKKQEQWRQANRKAIEEYNHRVSKHGVFSDKHRLF